jgi:hypothetical protein
MYPANKLFFNNSNFRYFQKLMSLFLNKSQSIPGLAHNYEFLPIMRSLPP